jgi:Gas vesicle synthesis protein GvpL/GvpF
MSAPAQSGRADTPATHRGYYVYGIVPRDVAATEDADGVGDPPARVEVVQHGEIAALVSAIDVTKPLGRPEDLATHQHLLDATSAEAPVLPIRFGTVLTDADAVVQQLLAPHHDEFAAALEELEGHAEYVVNGKYVEETVLRGILADSPHAARLRDEIREAGDEDATRDPRIPLGELIRQAISAQRDDDTRTLIDAVDPYCAEISVREPTHEDDAAHIALLVDTDRQKDLEQALGELAEEWDGRLTLRLLGPMAPYDFVAASVPDS